MQFLLTTPLRAKLNGHGLAQRSYTRGRQVQALCPPSWVTGAGLPEGVAGDICRLSKENDMRSTATEEEVTQTKAGLQAVTRTGWGNNFFFNGMRNPIIEPRHFAGGQARFVWGSGVLREPVNNSCCLLYVYHVLATTLSILHILTSSILAKAHRIESPLYGWVNWTSVCTPSWGHTKWKTWVRKPMPPEHHRAGVIWAFVCFRVCVRACVNQGKRVW